MRKIKQCKLALLWIKVNNFPDCPTYVRPVLRIWFHWARIRILHFSWIPADLDPGFDDQHGKNYNWKIITVFWSTVTIYLSIGLHNGRPNYRRSLQASKEKIQHFKHDISEFFSSIFVGHLTWGRIRMRIGIKMETLPYSMVGTVPYFARQTLESYFY